jgi:hypothetical protein
MKHLSGMIQRTLAVTCLVTGSLATVSLLPEYSTGHVLASEPAGQEVKPVAEIVQGKGYQPPPPDRSSGPRRTTGGGTRGGGCEQQGEIDLTVLAPQTHIGQTASDHPTLVWYVPDGTEQRQKPQWGRAWRPVERAGTTPKNRPMPPEMLTARTMALAEIPLPGGSGH